MLVAYFSDRYDFSKWFTSRHISFKWFGKKVHTHLYGILGGIMLILIGLVMFFQQGTRIFMQKIPELVPWTMSFFTAMNESLVKSDFFTGTIANIIGAAIGILLLYSMLRVIKNNKRYKHEHSHKEDEAD